MYPPVTNQFATRGKTFGAVCTAKRPLAAVHPFMAGQVAGLDEIFAAFTDVRPLARVYPQVGGQLAALGKMLAAHGAGVWLLT